jgi:tetratricopeptide (TPR) repeat protein
MPVLRSHRIVAAALAWLLFCAFPPFSPADEHKKSEYEIAATKGAFFLETKDYASAITSFKKALEIQPGDKTAATGLGIAYSRSGNFPDAKEALLAALPSDASDARVRYELGIVMYKLGEPAEAKDFFSSVIEGKADDTLKSAARRYLDIISGKGAGEKKGLSIGILGGLQYDTNVILQPDNPPAGQEQRKTDWRAVFSLDSAYRFVKSEKTSADAGYQFYQSAHRTLHEFNIQQHSLRLAATHGFSDTIDAGVKYTLSYTLAGGSRFSVLNEAIPFVTVAFSPASRTEFHVIYDNERFRNSALFPLNDLQTGTDNTAGFLHTVRLGASSSFFIGYDYDAKDANERFWSYRGSRGQIGLQGKRGPCLASISASYFDQRYRDVFPGFTDKRHDGVQEYSLELSRGIAKDLSLNLSELYTVHDSNLPVFEYTRNIIGIFMVTRL